MEFTRLALTLAGAALVCAVLADVGDSILGDSGRGGWLTGRLGRAAWRAMLTNRRAGHHRPSALVGRVIIVATPLLWFVVAGAGFLAVVAAHPGSVRAGDGTSTDLVEKAYFVGYSMLTLGNGEYRPVSGTWQIVTILLTLTGFALITLAVTFIVPVVQAGTTRRQTASIIAAHGPTRCELARTIDAGAVDPAMLASQIVQLAEQHAAFPVLHYLHTAQEHRSAPAMLATLALALGDSGDDAHNWSVLEDALAQYLELHPFASGSPADEATWLAVRRDDGRAVAD